ncbi:hypothetical protein VCHE48_0536 [Vibrio cholerae HE48]|nr:hypothetical protein VCHE48_0536 [Vibrio cholerae HE48]
MPLGIHPILHQRSSSSANAVFFDEKLKYFSAKKKSLLA